MVEIMTELIAECVSEGELDISENESRQLSHNILVMGQMWTFRRWAVQKSQTIEAYTNQQIKQLLGAYLVKR